MALLSKHHENQWDCILIDPRNLNLYEKGELEKKAIVKVNNTKALPEATECHKRQIMVNLLTKVDCITLTQGTVDWKYARRFSFTSASSYDIINVCLTKLWHLYENKPHWQAVKAYLDGAFPFISEVESEQTEEIQEVPREQDSSDENGSVYASTPMTIQEQVAYYIEQINTGQITSSDFRSSPAYLQSEYLKHFILYITRKAAPNHRKKMPSTQNALKKAVDQWLDEPTKKNANTFFLKWTVSKLP